MRKLFFLIALTVWITSCTTTPRPQDNPPNVVIIMADDLGYGDLSGYGNPTVRTPHLDALAANGIKFTDFHSNGVVCSPTRAALMTGKYQQRTGVTGVVTAKSHRDVGLSLSETTIAEEFKSHGYRTAMFGKWHLGYAAQYGPTHQGFDEFVGFVSGNVDYHAHIDQEGYLDWWQGTKIENEAGYTTDLITEYGVQFIREHQPSRTDKPFFLYLPHEAPHGPYQRRIDRVLREVGSPHTEPVHQDSIAAIYREMVEVMDEGIGKVVAALKETGQYENTIIVFASDNGANRYGNNGILRGHKGSPFEGGSRVPAIFSYPKVIRRGGVTDGVVFTMDLLPTLLDFIGRKPTGENVDGISIREHLVNGTELPERDVFMAFGNRSFVRRGDWKLIRVATKAGETFHLYDLATDLAEAHDLSADHPTLVQELAAALAAWKEEVEAGVTVVS